MLATAQVKIIDFNHSRLFNIDDSPFRIRKRTKHPLNSSGKTEEQVWKAMSELNSPTQFIDSAKRSASRSPEKNATPPDNKQYSFI